jgi:hypothetical protein
MIEFLGQAARFVMLAAHRSCCRISPKEDLVVHSFEPETEYRLTPLSGAWRRFLTEDDLAHYATPLEPFLRRFDYPLERRAATENISPETGSLYAERLIDEARLAYLAAPKKS